MSTVQGVYNGSDVLLYLDSEIVVHSTDTSFKIGHKLKDTTARETNGWKTSVQSTRDWEVSVEGAVAFRTTGGTLYSNEPNYINVTEIINNHIINRNTVLATIVPPGIGVNNLQFMGYTYITSVSVEAANEDTATYSITLSGLNHSIFGTTGTGS
tara:strand:+ start:5211 stop:5675 length:465 start_codon:yes stop_codon:yes gene_type:complete